MDKDKKFTIAIAGNPNCGKTTLFNELTGGKQRVGNWPGVTVEKKEGRYKYNDKIINVIDLPGIYSLSAYSEDEKVACDYILSGEPDLVVNIVDATNLDRNLFLTIQLIEMKVPVLILLNMMDVVAEQHIDINIELLAKELDLPVIGISAVNSNDIARTKKYIEKSIINKSISNHLVKYPNEVENLIEKWSNTLKKMNKEININNRWIAIKLFENDYWIKHRITKLKYLNEKDIDNDIKKIESILKESSEIILADYRYGFIHSIIKMTVKKRPDKKSLTDKIDKIILNKMIGLPIFLVTIYLVFWITINIGGAFIDFFDIFFGAIFVDGTKVILTNLNTPLWIIALLADGIGTGIKTVMTFVPIIFIMFLILSILEDSGYMARAAFLMDKYMKFIGLPGKSFVPLIVGFGCTVPAIMATRTLDSKKDRFLTIFMTPLMSCGARLPVYALFTASFFNKSVAGNVVFSIYLTGILLSVLTGLIFKNTIFKGEPSYFIMELPPYNMLRIKHILFHTWFKLRLFIFKAGKMIIIAITILGFLNSIGIDGSIGNTGSKNSVLSKLGILITPVFKPMGIKKENWPASVALLTGLFAKESVIGTLNSLYTQMDSQEVKTEAGISGFNIIENFKNAFLSIKTNLLNLFFNNNSYNNDEKFAILLKKYFSTNWVTAYAYLLFVLIYFPCVAALGAIIREIGVLMGILNVAYLTVLGWITATLFYQILTGHQLLWIVFPIILFILIIGFLYILSKIKKSEILE